MALAAENYTDVPNEHWASGVIAKWSGDGYGVLSGNGDQTFAPSRGLTLGEFAAILSKTFGYSERVESQVTPAWSKEFVEKAMAAGVLEKAERLDASAYVSREEAVRYIAIAYGIAPVQGETAFSDNQAIGEEFKPYVAAFQKLGYVVGKGNGVFDPKGAYTRAEAMQVIDSATSEILDSSITGAVYSKALIIRKPGVTIKNVQAKSNIIIGQGVGDGETVFENVSIDGSLVVNGGGTLRIRGLDSIAKAEIDKPYGKEVRLDGSFGTVVIEKGTKAAFSGKADKIILSGDNELSLVSASVKDIVVEGEKVNLLANSGSAVDLVTVGASNVSIKGDGKVKKVLVTSKAKTGVEVLTYSTEVTVESGAGAVKTNGGMVQAGKSLSTSAATSQSSSNSSSNQTTPTPPTTPTTPTPPVPGFEEGSGQLLLTVDKDTVIIGDSNNELRFLLSSELVATDAALYVYGQSEPVTLFHDNGSNGDDMAGDGIYTAIYNLNATVEGDYAFAAKLDGDTSNTVIVKAVNAFTEQELAQMEQVDQALEEVISSTQFAQATLAEKKAIAQGKLNELATEGLIESSSIQYDDDASIFSFTYQTGALGAVLLKEFAPDYDGLFSLFSSATTGSGLETTGSALMPNVGIASGSALILNAFPEFETDPEKIGNRTNFYEALKAEWAAYGFNADLDTNVTIEDFKRMAGFNVIVIATHGGTLNGNPFSVLAEKMSEQKDLLYSAELKGQQIVRLTSSIGSTYGILPGLIEGSYKASDLEGSFVFLQPCESLGKNGSVNRSLSDAFVSRGAEAVVGFIDSVYSEYGREFMKLYINSLLEGKTAQEAFDLAVSTIGSVESVLEGNVGASLFRSGIYNGDFSSKFDLQGIPGGWIREGDVRSVALLGDIKTQGDNNLRMAILSTGIGATANSVQIADGTEGSIMSQRFYVPADASFITFEYDYVSEEPMEFVGSMYNDSFGYQLSSGSDIVSARLIETVNASYNGSTWIPVGGIDFYGGDQTVFHTGWKTYSIDVSALRGKLVTLSFVVFDKGDSIYDSACLIDNVVVS
jgi:hypothetical protein